MIITETEFNAAFKRSFPGSTAATAGKLWSEILKFCVHTNVEGGPVDISTPYAYQNVVCLECGKERTEHYRLIEPGNPWETLDKG